MQNTKESDQHKGRKPGEYRYKIVRKYCRVYKRRKEEKKRKRGRKESCQGREKLK